MHAMRRAVPFLVAGLVALVGGCATYQLVEPGPVQVGGEYEVSPKIAWSKREFRGVQYWTIDGEELHRLIFYAGVKGGESLFVGRTEEDKDFPIYRANMRATDVQDLVVASYRKGGAQDVEPQGLRPAEFGALDGFRFSLQYRDRNGLNRQAMVMGAKDDDRRLHLIIYEGVSQVYFPRYEQSVDDLMGSVKTI